MPPIIKPLIKPAGDAGPRLSPDVSDGILPADPAVRAFIADMLDSLKYSFAVAAAEVPVASPAPLDIAFREYLDSRSEAVRTRHRLRSAAALQASPEARRQSFGRYGAIAPQQYAAVGQKGVTALAAPLVLPAIKPAPGLVLKPTKKKPILKIPPGVQDAVEGAKFKKLGIFLKKVHCEEETDEVGSDEIALGGVRLDPDGKTSQIIDEFIVSEDFDEGEPVLFPKPVLPANFDPQAMIKAFQEAEKKPGRLLVEWKLRTDLGWPAAYTAVIAMVEKDDGGFWKLLKDLLRTVRELVEDHLGKSIGTAIGTAIGALFGPAGAAVGAIAGFLIGALLDAILADNPDDIVATRTLVLSLGAATKSYYDWAGLTKLPHPAVFPVHFKGDGGHYVVSMYYQIYA